MNLLYRYYRRLDFVLDAIINRRLYFAAPGEFNDPFDSKPKFSLLFCKKDPEEDWRRYFFILAKNQYPGISDDEVRKHADGAILRGLHRDRGWLLEADEEIKKALAQHSRSIRICCFSKSPRNATMWAHYADNHKGVVLQFKKSGLLDDDGTYKGFDVEYYRRPIPLQRYVRAMEETEKGDNKAFGRLIYCSKSHEWASEDEVRILSQETHLTYPEEMLTGILLGSDSPSHSLDMLYTVLSTWPLRPKIFKEDRSVSSIKLCFKLA